MDQATRSRKTIQQNGFALSKTSGNSMRPLIWGDQHCVAVAPLDGEPKVGDLLLFQLPIGERNVVHRLVDIRQNGDHRLYITRGDNCLVCENVRREEIIGRVAEVHRISRFRPWHIIPAKQFAVTDRAYLRYLHFWTAIWPIRRQYYLLRAHIRGLHVRLLSVFKSK